MEIYSNNWEDTCNIVSTLQMHPKVNCWDLAAMNVWCKNNIQNQWKADWHNGQYVFHFIDDQDRMLFIQRWIR